MIFGLFRCQHPARALAVRSEQRVAPDSDTPEDHEIVTYRLLCMKCGRDVDIRYARLIGGVAGFMARGRGGA